jgi:uncharacterized protein YkwD
MIDKFTDWYFISNNAEEIGLVRGPFSTAEMREFLKNGEISGNTLIRYGRRAQWQCLRDVQRFVPAPRKPRKTFWKKNGVAVLVFSLIIFAFMFLRSQLPSPPSESANPVGFPMPPASSVKYTFSQEDLNREAIITLTNDARAMNGLPPLRANPLLNDIAEARARDMLEKQYFAHVSPTGQQASDIAQTVGYHYKIIGENIASGNFLANRKIVDGWMQSPGHRANILGREVDEIGAAVIKGRMKGSEAYVAVQIFGLQSLPVAPHATCAAPSKDLLAEIELKKAEIEGLNDQLQRMKKELDEESESIETDRKYTYDNREKIQSLNVRIAAHNEENRWFNRVATDAQAKSLALTSMVNEYNRMVQAYDACRSSAK